MLKELQDIGLSEKESRVYLAALELGNTTAEKLATQAKVNRSTTYVQLESLMKMGLMSTYEEGKKTYFAPESPTYLKRILDMKRAEIGAREKELVSLMPELTHLFEGAGERPLVRFYMGKEGVSTLRDQILEAKKVLPSSPPQVHRTTTPTLGKEIFTLILAGTKSAHLGRGTRNISRYTKQDGTQYFLAQPRGFE